ncbi:MAG TPA: phytanoyl-CoA dioxygenase family protein [Synechococcales cyanobacterium M55_K2018_004]|nr:phytanoyl-CoA dioxygenase family protein [Synechococcales cyanobacterium M55_K2018_004]
MKPQERYLFDLQGFLVIEDALTPDQVNQINAAINQKIAQSSASDQRWLRFDCLLPWGSVFQDLIDNPRLAPYLEALLGEDYRLDHDYLHIIRQGTGPIGNCLHGGGTPYDPCQYYHVRHGQMFSGLTAIAYQLTEVQPGEGGFGCIPGSHKSNFPLPQEWRDLETPVGCVREVTGPVGSAILFTEALSHGTLIWKGQRERRTLFYKYSPRPNAWARYYYNADDFPNLTAAQRLRLKTPGLSR